jgi:hypothetical protein
LVEGQKEIKKNRQVGGNKGGVENTASIRRAATTGDYRFRE